jgi:hypothetical protein
LDSGSQQHVASSAEDFYKSKFFKIFNTAIKQLEEKCDQPDFNRVIQMKRCLIKGVTRDEFEFLSIFPELDVNRLGLSVHLPMFKQQYKCDSVIDAVKILTEIEPSVRQLFEIIEVLVKLLIVVPASSAEAARSFSMLRRLKTWLRSTMGQERLNHLAILNFHWEVLDKIDLNLVARDFFL